MDYPEIAAKHYVHISSTNPKLIAYTASVEEGRKDIQTPIKVGRYLQKYYGEYLDNHDITKIIEKHNAHYCTNLGKLKFAHTPDEIEHVYHNGPDSCMRKKAWPSVHPARVYGAGDLAVAYYETDDGRITARCVCFPERKVRTMCYGNVARIIDVMDQAGYKRDDDGFIGARLLHIPYSEGDDPNDCVMPYLDFNANVDFPDNEGKFLICVETSKGYNTQVTSGLLLGFRLVCCMCNTDTEEGDGHTSPEGEHFCENCFWETYFTCDSCSNTFSINDVTQVHHPNDRYSRVVCPDCLDQNYCECGDCIEYYRLEDIVGEYNGVNICAGCYENGVYYFEACSGEMRHFEIDNLCDCDECKEARGEPPEDDSGNLEDDHQQKIEFKPKVTLDIETFGKPTTGKSTYLPAGNYTVQVQTLAYRAITQEMDIRMGALINQESKDDENT
jgi:hypothetical protein